MPRHRTSQARHRTTAVVAAREEEKVHYARYISVHERFKHNFHVSIALFPALLIVAWNVDFAARMFMCYGGMITIALDLLDISREYPVVSLGMFTSFALLAMWVSFVRTNASWWNLLLAQQMTLVMLLVAVWSVLQFPWVWSDKIVQLRYVKMLEHILLHVLPFPSSALLVWQMVELFPEQTFHMYCFAQCGVCIVYWSSLCSTRSNALLLEVMFTLMNPCLFAVANRGKHAHFALLLRTVFLSVLPQFFKFELNLKYNSKWLALCCVCMALMIDPTVLLAAMGIGNVVCNLRSPEHWFISLIAWSFSLAAVQNPNQVVKSCAVLFACYFVCFVAWYTTQQNHKKRLLVVVVSCVCIISWEISHMWQVIGMIISLVLAGIVHERSQAGLLAFAVMFALQVERAAVMQWEYETAYLFVTTFVAVIITIVAFYQTQLGLTTSQQRSMVTKFALVVGFLRFLFPVHGAVLAVCSLLLMLAPWHEYFLAVVAIEMGLCFFAASEYSSNVAAVLCIFMVSASILFQSHQSSALLPQQQRAFLLRCVLAVLHLLPLLLLSNADAIVAYLCLAALGILISTLDVFEDWVILLLACVFTLPANPLVAVIIVGSLSFCLVKPYFAHGKRAKAVGLCMLMCYCCWKAAAEEELRLVAFCLAVLCTLSHYCHLRERTLRELNFAFQVERECTLLFTGTYCLVVYITAYTVFVSSPFARSLSAFALYFTIFPLQIKCRIVLAMQILLQATSSSTSLWSLIGLFLFFSITELYIFVDTKNRLLFASPLLAVLVYLQPTALAVSACTLLASLAAISLLQTPHSTTLTTTKHQNL